MPTSPAKTSDSKKPKSTKPKSTKPKKPQLTAAQVDKYELYQYSVQNTEHEIEFIGQLFRKLRKREAISLREDFCGTALLCADWIKSNPKRVATGVDIDPEPLTWGTVNNLAPLGEPGERITLIQDDVMNVSSGEFDCAVAFNFSYWLFRKREVMREYFSCVLASLKKDGVFFLDTYGGWEAYEPMEEPRKVVGPGGAKFTYVWHQAAFNPIDNFARNFIHFRFKDGTALEKAFGYDWRVWTPVEIKELLEEVGFKDVTIYWEDEDAEGEGTGVYRPRTEVNNDPGWLAYIVAEK